jgi:DNA-binding MarR family transcriptional regulator
MRSLERSSSTRASAFLVRLLDTRVHLLYEQLTGQNDITPRQFGVLLTLHQQGTLTLTELAGHIRVDRSTLGEMINRMADAPTMATTLGSIKRRRSSWGYGARAVVEVMFNP